jgi:hypothetical protein
MRYLGRDEEKEFLFDYVEYETGQAASPSGLGEGSISSVVSTATRTGSGAGITSLNPASSSGLPRSTSSSSEGGDSASGAGSERGDGGVSIQVLVGAVVGTLVGTALLLAVAFFCYRWRRRIKKEHVVRASVSEAQSVDGTSRSSI